MVIRSLKSKFNQSRDYNTDDVNALLDFAKKAYIHNEIDIKEYRLVVRELEAQGAMIPDDFNEDSLIENA
ncbi:YppF family protein [Neobacillus vireti]|uniref:YppF family protein n=1 Tax=Neobacillus vireti TaxID=220686 RepID=UPI002FFE2189